MASSSVVSESYRSCNASRRSINCRVERLTGQRIILVPPEREHCSIIPQVPVFETYLIVPPTQSRWSVSMTMRQSLGRSRSIMCSTQRSRQRGWERNFGIVTTPRWLTARSDVLSQQLIRKNSVHCSQSTQATDNAIGSITETWCDAREIVPHPTVFFFSHFSICNFLNTTQPAHRTPSE